MQNIVVQRKNAEKKKNWGRMEIFAVCAFLLSVHYYYRTEVLSEVLIVISSVHRHMQASGCDRWYGGGFIE